MAVAGAVTGGSGGDPQLDLVMFSPIFVNGASTASNAGMLLVSVDSAMTTAHLEAAVGVARGAGPLARLQQLAWMCACPLTGSGWVRTY